MKHLIIAKNLRYFWNHIEDRFEGSAIAKVNRTQGKVWLTDGDELIYISSNNGLRGYHGVCVEMWSMPDWYDIDLTDKLAQLARMP